MSLSITSYAHFLLECQTGVPLTFQDMPANHTDPSIHLEHEIDLIPKDQILMAYAKIDIPTGRLLLHFLRHTVCSKKHRVLFNNGFFNNARNRPISNGAASALGLITNNVLLQQGRYPILSTEHFWTVSLQLGHLIAEERPLPQVLRPNRSAA